MLATATGVTAAFASDPSVSTVAGNGSGGSSGDSGAATLAEIDKPEDVSLLGNGGFLIADTQSDRIREVAPNGTITTVAGTGQGGSAGDGGPAVDAELRSPSGVAALPGGGFLIADTENDLIRKVASNGDISTVAGPNLDEPRSVAPLAGGGFLIADTEGHQIRKVDGLGIESVVAGTGQNGYDGDGGLAILAKLDKPYDVAPLPGGGFLFSDHAKGVVRKVDAFGVITTVAGDGGSGADGIPATSAELKSPAGVVPLASGGFLVVAEDDHVVRWVNSAGVIQTVAGNGDNGFAGDLGDPLDAEFDSPLGLAATGLGDQLLLADTKNNRIREIALSLLDDGPPPDDDEDEDEDEEREDEDEDDDGGPRPPARGPAPASSPPEQERPASKDAPPAPVLGKAVGVTPSRGTVRVRARGSKRFITLTAGDSIPVGSTIDARRGRVALSSALNSSGKVQTAQFWGGIFKVGQSRSGRGMTDIALLGGRPSCAKAPAKASISKRKRKRSRRGAKLWAKDKRGRFRTRGSNSVATTRGTFWLTQERCNGTLTKVYEGAVVVRNRKTGKRVTVRAGKRYLARRKR